MLFGPDLSVQSQFSVCTFCTAYNLMCHLHRFCRWKATKDLLPKCAAQPSKVKSRYRLYRYIWYLYIPWCRTVKSLLHLNDNIYKCQDRHNNFFCTIRRFFMRPIFHFHPGVNVGSEFSSGCIQRLQLKHLIVRTIFSP